MKKLIVIAIFLVTSFAHASLPRQLVLGGQPLFTSNSAGDNSVTSVVNGALWYEDDYNIFYNPSQILNHGNYATIQVLEGGYFTEIGESFAGGIYFNRGGGGAEQAYAGHLVSPGLRSTSNLVGNATPLSTQRPIDFFFGGDFGVKWGVHGSWAFNRNDTGATGPSNRDGGITNQYWHADAGIQLLGLEIFGGTTIQTEFENDLAGQKAKQNLQEFNFGIRYVKLFDEFTPYIVLKNYRQNGTPVNGATQNQIRFNMAGLGVGRESKVAEGVVILQNIGAWVNFAKDDTASAVFNRDYRETVLPLNLAIEAEALSWLDLRAGATYNLWHERKHDKTSTDSAISVSDRFSSRQGTATFRLGSTIKFGKLHIDSGFSREIFDVNVGDFKRSFFALVSASYYW